MDAIFKKLNYKDQQPILILDAPDSFLPNMDAMASACRVITNLEESESLDFALAFVSTQTAVDTYAAQIHTRLKGDAVLWFAYPKKSSKRYICDFNRDTGWTILGTLGYEPVRIVAIDNDWTALRFRRVQYIKQMTRSFAMTKEGKEKATK